MSTIDIHDAVAELLTSRYIGQKNRDNLEREHARFESGEIEAAGFTEFLSRLLELHRRQSLIAAEAIARQINNPLVQTLGDTPCWLLWRYGRPHNPGAKPKKIPLSPETMDATDGATTVGKVMFATLLDKLKSGTGLLGVTLGSYGDVQLSGFDIDNCLDENNRMDARAQAILAASKGFVYVEVSPSNRGLKGFVLAPLHLSGTSGNVEVYDANRFFTVTGRCVAGFETLRDPTFDELAGLQGALLEQEGVERCEALTPAAHDDDLSSLPILAYIDPLRVKQNILRFLNPAGVNYEEWIEVGMALHHQFSGSDTGLDLWDEWSAPDEARYPKNGRRGLEAHYKSFGKTRPGKKRITLRTLLQKTTTARREATRAENRERCTHEDIPVLVERLSADEVEARFIYISGTDAVGDKHNPRAVRTFASARNHYAASKAAAGQDGAVTNAFALWKGRAGRETVDAVTWRPGFPLVTRSPDGMSAFNTYQPFNLSSGEFHQEHADAFVQHVRLLFADRTDDFLDWLAHIEQRPGTLPHQAWLHVATQTGVGRNLIASVLGRVWGSGVAQSFDLNSALDGGFNGELSQRILVVVDEIRESGADAHRRAQKLKSIITETVRHINPKYGTQHAEFNCARWLMFSNFRSAVPIEQGDRRIEIVIYDGPPMSEEYYADLYGMLDDRDFIWSVRQMLATRDISNFNPGARAKLTKHKLQAIATSRSDALTELIEFTEGYQWPLVSGEILRKQMTMEIDNKRFSKLVEDAGWVRLPGKHLTHLKPRQIPLYVKREHYNEWADNLTNKNTGLPDELVAATLLQVGGF